MQSWQILSHSIKMVVNNFSTAMRLAVPLIGAMVLSLILFGPQIYSGTVDFDMQVDPLDEVNYAVNTGIASLIQGFAALWVAVAWHRYILLEEMPSGILPTLHGGRVLAYFGWGLLIGVLMGIFIFVFGGIGGLLISFGTLGTLIGGALIIAATLAAFYISARIYVILPSAAIGQTLSFSQAWEATRGYGGSIILAYIMFVVFAIVVSVVVGLMSAIAGLIGTLVLMALNIVLIMIGMSFLTTIYGVAVENRDL